MIIGAGFGGLAAAVALRRRGIDDLTIIERSDGVGGTWRRNVYPGAACDIQSHLYSFSFAPNRAWSRTYAYQPEILDYLESVADDFDLRRHLMLNTGVRSMRMERAGVELGRELTARRHRGRRCRGERRRAVRLRPLPRYRRPRRLLRHAHAHRAMGCDRRPQRQAGGGDRNRGQRCAGRARTRRRRRRIDGISSAHRRGWSRRRIGPTALRSCPDTVGCPGRQWRERWRLWKLQHDNTALTPDHPRMAVVEKLSRGFLRQARRRRPAARCADAAVPVPLQAGPARREVLHRTATRPRRPRHRTHHRVTESGIITADGTAIDVDAIVLATGFETSSYLSGLDVIGVDGESLHERWGWTRRPISAPPSAGFRTSSCCTARTPTRAPTRSSTSWRRVLGSSPARSAG